MEHGVDTKDEILTQCKQFATMVASVPAELQAATEAITLLEESVQELGKELFVRSCGRLVRSGVFALCAVSDFYGWMTDRTIVITGLVREATAVLRERNDALGLPSVEEVESALGELKPEHQHGVEQSLDEEPAPSTKKSARGVN